LIPKTEILIFFQGQQQQQPRDRAPTDIKLPVKPVSK